MQREISKLKPLFCNSQVLGSLKNRLGFRSWAFRVEGLGVEGSVSKFPTQKPHLGSLSNHIMIRGTLLGVSYVLRKHRTQKQKV